MHILDGHLTGIERCPQCGVADPRLSVVRRHYAGGCYWSLVECATCNRGILTESYPFDNGLDNYPIRRIYPQARAVAAELPERVRTYLAQAMGSLHAPDGAAMLAGSAVDAMLKDKGFNDGSVYARIDEAVDAGILTPDMGQWAHEVRLGANRPRHADADDPHVTPEQAEQAVEFTATLGHILYVLPDRVERGKAKALAAEG